MNSKHELSDLIKQPSQDVTEQDAPVSARTKARRAALQALYQWHVNASDLYQIEKQFFEAGWLSDLDRDLFHELLVQIAQQVESLDEEYAQYLDRHIKMLNTVERNILRIATYELKTQLQVPYKVVINEAVELTKRFGAEDAHKYINGVLDKVARQLRPLEFQAPAS